MEVNKVDILIAISEALHVKISQEAVDEIRRANMPEENSIMITYLKQPGGKTLTRNQLGKKEQIHISRQKFLLEIGLLRGLGFKITEYDHKITVEDSSSN